MSVSEGTRRLCRPKYSSSVGLPLSRRKAINAEMRAAANLAPASRREEVNKSFSREAVPKTNSRRAFIGAGKSVAPPINMAQVVGKVVNPICDRAVLYICLDQFHQALFCNVRPTREAAVPSGTRPVTAPNRLLTTRGLVVESRPSAYARSNLATTISRIHMHVRMSMFTV